MLFRSAVYLDLENIALGARDARYPPFNIQKVLERLLLKGHIVVRKAYCDFDRYKEFKRDLHEAAFELIEIPRFDPWFCITAFRSMHFHRARAKAASVEVKLHIRVVGEKGHGN